ncbi:hypothetical protein CAUPRSCDRAFT_12969 [Caulochytrium protostelioides]|uniref:Uncharacterized protein n=1 Tax=Caulochytrium protostelioides TaxID=1555241 RepID=A0A4P9WSG9_9FUNG|nr:hypothetical protein CAUPRSCDRAFT_12969 [Caulochytrium protostelioides]
MVVFELREGMGAQKARGGDEAGDADEVDEVDEVDDDDGDDDGDDDEDEDEDEDNEDDEDDDDEGKDAGGGSHGVRGMVRYVQTVSKNRDRSWIGFAITVCMPAPRNNASDTASVFEVTARMGVIEL